MSIFPGSRKDLSVAGGTPIPARVEQTAKYEL